MPWNLEKAERTSKENAIRLFSLPMEQENKP